MSTVKVDPWYPPSSYVPCGEPGITYDPADDDEPDPRLTFPLGKRYDDGEDCVTRLGVFDLPAGMKEYLTEQGFKYSIYGDIRTFRDAGFGIEAEATYWIEFADPDEAMFFKFRWK